MAKIEKEELDYLKTVRNFMDSEIVKLSNLSVELEELIMKEGQKFAQDDPYQAVYGSTALTELHYSIERKMIRSETAKQDAYFLQGLRSHPYFARIDFKEDNYPTEQFYIGLKSLFDEKEISPYVYDWRAPVAGLFYEEFDGKAFYEAPSGRIEGEIERKRQYKFENGELVYCFDSDIKIDDYILQQALSETSTDRLKVIVSSIQKEQNKAIRFGGDKNLIICGPAGSGKTSVGFHRIAYLLYRYRHNLSSAEVVLFTGSDIFASYVSDIIPELGEAPIKDFNFYALLRNGMQAEDYYEQAEAIISKEKGREEAAKIKNSAEFISFVENYINNYCFKFSDFSLYGDPVYSGEEISAYLKSRPKITEFEDKLTLVSDFANDKINSYFANNYEKLYEIADEQSSILDDTGDCIEAMKKQIKQEVRNKLNNELNVDDYSLLCKIYEAFGNNAITKQYKKDIGSGIIKFEDAMIVLFIRCLMGKMHQKSKVRHVLIDEAQDFSMLQHKIILHLYPKARFTILTDSNQAIVPTINSSDVNELAELYSAEILKLQKSYRSTKQISNFAMKLLTSPDYETFERDGEEPLIIESNDIFSDIKTAIKNAEGSVCVITKTSPTARRIYNELILDTDIELYDDKDKIFGSKAAIMPVVYTKGLEFDNVIIVSENDEFFGKENNPYLYMATTRALHKLTIIKD
ncbi:MAG: UvrD-helicase domain-containing protein [Clostridia bacterium]|nr:UvrD-helicase domain-containing protein [Clostridia bacterium]